MRSTITVACLLLLSLSCGKHDDPPPQAATTSPVNLHYLPGMTASQRTQFCFLGVTPELDMGARGDYFKALSGSWQHYPSAGAGTKDLRRTFKLDLGRGVGSVSEYDGLVTNISDIAYGKACLSTPMPEGTPFAGYRLVQMMAKDNEGAVGLFTRMDPPTASDPSPTLNLSGWYYTRFAASNETLEDLADVYRKTEVTQVWVYAVHQP